MASRKKAGKKGSGGGGALRWLAVLAALCALTWGALVFLEKSSASSKPAPSHGGAAAKPAPSTSKAGTVPQPPPVYAADPALKAEPAAGLPPKIPQRFYPGPVAGEAARMAIILDDVGYDAEAARRAMALGVPLTFSVLPNAPMSRELAREIHRRGFEVWLHLPMEAQSAAADPGEGAVRSGMTRDQVTGAVLDALKAVPYIRGVNNHMGSKVTRDAQVMGWALAPVKQWNLLFVDSKTTPDTQGFAVAKSLGIPCSIRDVFLDTEADLPHALAELRRLENAARAHGTALGIGHFYPSTLAALETFVPKLDPKKVEIVPASEIVEAENPPLEL